MRNEIVLDPYIHLTLLRDLVGHDHKPTAFLVYLWLYAEQQRLGEPIAISYFDRRSRTSHGRKIRPREDRTVRRFDSRRRRSD